MYIPIHWQIMECWILPKPKTKQDEARSEETRQDEAAPWQEAVPSFDNYCIHLRSVLARINARILE